MSHYGDQEIDLRPYANALYRSAPYILVAALLMGIAGYLISGLMAPSYEASTLVAVSEPRYTLDFDSRIQVSEEDVGSIYDALPILATSDELLAILLQDEALFADSEATLGTLRGMLDSEPLARPSLIALTATSKNPERAARLVNQWSDLLVQRANAVFIGRGIDQAGFFTNQVAAAAQELDEAQTELETFAARDEGAALTAELDVLLATKTAYLENQQMIDQLIRDANSLSDQLDGKTPSSTASTEDRLASILLQVRAFGGTTEFPVQLQLGGVEQVGDATVADQEVYLENLTAALTQRSVNLEQRLEALTPEILRLQQAVQVYETEQQRLEDAVALARDTHTILARKAEESDISGQDVSGVVQLASRAAVPTEPASPNKVLNALAAAVLGLLIASAAVLVLQVRSQAQSTDAVTPVVQDRQE